MGGLFAQPQLKNALSAHQSQHLGLVLVPPGEVADYGAIPPLPQPSRSFLILNLYPRSLLLPNTGIKPSNILIVLLVRIAQRLVIYVRVIVIWVVPFVTTAAITRRRATSPHWSLGLPAVAFGSTFWAVQTHRISPNRRIPICPQLYSIVPD